MQIMTALDNVKLAISAVIGGSTAVVAADMDRFIDESTPYIKYYGLVAGVVLTTILIIYWVKQTFFNKKKAKK